MTDQQEREQKVAEVKSKYKFHWWDSDNDFDIAWGQINEPVLIMDFSRFHEAVEKTLDRPVYTHEFGLNVGGMIEEMQGKCQAPSLAEIIELIPEEKRIVVQV